MRPFFSYNFDVDIKAYAPYIGKIHSEHIGLTSVGTTSLKLPVFLEDGELDHIATLYVEKGGVPLTSLADIELLADPTTDGISQPSTSNQIHVRPSNSNNAGRGYGFAFVPRDSMASWKVDLLGSDTFQRASGQQVRPRDPCL